MDLKPGQRIELLSMFDDPDPITPGTCGTVRRVTRAGSGPNRFWQVDVLWDSGRTLMLSIPPDQYRTIND